MTDLICRKSMTRCLTPGMCSPHGGCHPPETASAFRSLLVERNSLAFLLKRFVDGEHDQDENQAERHMYHDEAQTLLAYLGGDMPGHTLVPDEALRNLTAERDRAVENFDKAWRHDLIDKNNYQVLVSEVARLSRLAGFWRSPSDLPPLGEKVLVLCDAGTIGNPHHIGHRSGRWLQQSEVFGEGFMCEILFEGRVIGWAPFSELAGSKDFDRYQFIADSACDVSFYVANTDCGDDDTTPGPRVELTPGQYPVETFGSGKDKLDFAIDTLMFEVDALTTKEVATQSTDTENVSRHERR